VALIDAAIARQRHGTNVSTATDIDTTIEGMLFSMLSMPRLYNEDQMNSQLVDSQSEVEVGGW
jgi:hypothetical protein